MPAPLTCPLCTATVPAENQVETAWVRCNVRRFRDETFAVWRCPDCASIHAREPVNLEHYYRDYPFHNRELNLRGVFYRALLRRLRRVGLRTTQTILDYGCGDGAFVDHLHSRGFAGACGFDAFGGRFNEPELLDRRYDCVFSQDVVEHAADPRELLELFARLAKPGGLIVIGTPNAEAVDLARPERHVHILHQPYHRHILSKKWVIRTASRIGWTLVRYHPAAYYNTLIPGINARMWFRYARAHDDTMDLGFEPPRFSFKLLSPSSVFEALFGGFFCPELDVMYIFRATREAQRATTLPAAASTIRRPWRNEPAQAAAGCDTRRSSRGWERCSSSARG